MTQKSLNDRILDAAIEAASIHGVTRLSVADVAKRAGISRQTLYKHFGSKDELVAAAVLREAVNLTDDVMIAASGHEDPKDSLEAGVLAALRLTREHPLLDRVIRTEPEALVPFLVSDGGPVMMLGRSSIEAVLAHKMPGLSELTSRRLADMLIRLLVSYALAAPDDPPEVVARSVAAVLTDGALASIEQIDAVELLP